MKRENHHPCKAALLALLISASLGAQAQPETLHRAGPINETNATSRINADRLDHNADPAGRTVQKGPALQASQIIGKTVENEQSVSLGKIDDLILSDDFRVQYAVLSVGSTLGAGGQRIAVPVNEFRCSGNRLRLSASPEDLKNSLTSPSAEWGNILAEGWTRDITGFYGHPVPMSHQSTLQLGRDQSDADIAEGDRQAIRTSQGTEARELLRLSSTNQAAEPSSSEVLLRQSIDDTLRRDFTNLTPAQSITVEVVKGTVTLRGSVGTAAEKQRIEARIKAITGVSRVNNELDVKQ